MMRVFVLVSGGRPSRDPLLWQLQREKSSILHALHQTRTSRANSFHVGFSGRKNATDGGMRISRFYSLIN